MFSEVVAGMDTTRVFAARRTHDVPSVMALSGAERQETAHG